MGKREKVNVEIKVDGKVYPCRQTMGSMIRFKNETGKEVTEIDSRNISDIATYLYCCVASACAADKVDFDMSLMNFADAIVPEDMNQWADAIKGPDGGNDGDTEKKR